MADYVLSCSSTVDATPEWLDERDIKYVYFNYWLDGVPLKDDFGVTNSPAELYSKMLAGADAKTSQVGVGEYLEYFDQFLSQGKDVLHLTLDSGISGTINSAMTAKEQLDIKYPDRKLIVIDSLTATCGYALLMDKLAELRDSGMTIEQLAGWAEDHKRNVHVWFESSDLTFFIRGGRISKAAGIIGGMLNICPIMDVEPDGTLAVKEKVRTKRKAIRKLVDIIATYGQGKEGYDQKLFISHSECLPDAMAVKKLAIEKFPNLEGDIPLFNIGATIGVHTGPGTVVVGFWGTPRELPPAGRKQRKG